MPRAMPDGRSAGRPTPIAGRGDRGEAGLARLRRSRSEATLWNDCPTATSGGEPAVSDQEPFRSPLAAAGERGSHDEPWRPAVIPIVTEETITPWWAFRAPAPGELSMAGNGRQGEGAASLRTRATSLSLRREPFLRSL